MELLIFYSFSFNSNTKCKAEFYNNTLKISHTNKEFLEGLIDKYESVKNM